MNRAWRWKLPPAFVLAGFLLGLCVPALRGAGQADRWIGVTTPEYRMITTLSPKEAAAWAAEFSQFVTAMRQLLPVEPGRLTPLTIIVFARPADYDPYRGRDAEGKPLVMRGLFTTTEPWAVGAFIGPRIDPHLRRSLFHEAVHWYLSAQFESAPVWLREGLAEAFSSFQIVKGRAEWGHAIPEHVALLREARLMPLDELLGYPPERLYHSDSPHAGLIYAQSWGFLHYLLFGRNDLPAGAVLRYLAPARPGMTPEESFVAAFGADQTTVSGKFATYLRNGKYAVARLPVGAPPAGEWAPVPAFDRELALGRLALASRQNELAEMHAQQAVRAAPDEPLGRSLRGQVLELAKRHDEALADFEAAARSPDADWFVHCRLAANLAQVSRGSFTPAVARRIATGFERSINLRPATRGVHQGLAGALAAAEPVGPEDREFLELGRRLYPADGQIMVGLAVQLRRSGSPDEARTLLARALEEGVDHTVDSIKWARQLDEAWISEEFAGKYNALLKEQKLDDALRLVEAELARTPLSRARRDQLTRLQEVLNDSIKLQQIDDARGRADWPLARRLLQEIHEGTYSPAAKQRARLLLDDLDRRQPADAATKDEAAK